MLTEYALSEITGPLGLWKFPILNILRQMLLQLRQGQGLAPTAQVVNEERITWVDWKGRERNMVIHREVK
jgi:hypothetical protein